MKRKFQLLLLVLVGLLTSTCIYAMGGRDEGFYGGFLIGPTTTGTGGNQSSESSQSTSLGSQFTVGYELNPFFSYEAGLLLYPQLQSGTDDSTESGCSKSNQRKLFADILLKASFPITQNMGLLSKLGVATPIYLPYLNSCNESSNKIKFHPYLGFGAFFDLAEGTVLELSWNRLVVGGTTKNIDLYGIGLSYHF